MGTKKFLKFLKIKFIFFYINLIVLFFVNGCIQTEEVATGFEYFPTNEWITYTDSKYNFSISYPKYFRFKALEERLDKTVIKIFSASEPHKEGKYLKLYTGLAVDIFVLENPSRLSIEEFITKREEFPIDTEYKFERFELNGVIGQRITASSGRMETRVLLPRDGKVYKISANSQYPSDEKAELANQIINSFKFL